MTRISPPSIDTPNTPSVNPIRWMRACGCVARKNPGTIVDGFNESARPSDPTTTNSSSMGGHYDANASGAPARYGCPAS